MSAEQPSPPAGQIPGFRVANAVLALGCLLLAGCLSSTPPSNYYLLTPRAGEPPTGSTPSVGVGPIEIPEYLNRNGLVYRRAGNALEISSYERWAEPLMDGIARVVSLNLAGRLDTQSIQSFPWNPGRAPDYAVSIQLLALDASDQGTTLMAEWLLHRPAGNTVLASRISRLHQPPAAGGFAPADMAAAYSALLDQLSGQIADAIRADLQ